MGATWHSDLLRLAQPASKLFSALIKWPFIKTQCNSRSSSVSAASRCDFIQLLPATRGHAARKQIDTQFSLGGFSSEEPRSTFATEAGAAHSDFIQ